MIAGFLISGMSCSTSLVASSRSFNNKVFRMCQDFEDPNPIGKVCYRTCVKYKMLSSKCKEWETTKYDLTKRDDFLKFRSANFVLISEEKIK